MDDNSPASQAPGDSSRRRPGSWLPGAALALVAVPVLAGVIGALVLLGSQARVPRVAAGQLLNSLGTYESPDGATVLSLQPSQGTLLDVAVSSHEGTAHASSARFQFDGSKPWLFAFGPDGTLWSYIADQGPTSLHSYESSPSGSGVTTIGVYGGWDDIPAPFLKALPEELQAIHEQWLAKQMAGAE
jgi:hypothetical protein